MRHINSVLRKNRLVLEKLNKDGKTKKHRDQLLMEGFDFDYFTSVFTNKSGDMYKFCYEQGFLDIGNGFYLLVAKNTES